MCGISNGIGPQANINTVWPTINGMKKNLSRLLLDVPDRPFGALILEIGIDPIVSEELLVLAGCVMKAWLKNWPLSASYC